MLQGKSNKQQLAKFVFIFLFFQSLQILYAYQITNLNPIDKVLSWENHDNSLLMNCALKRTEDNAVLSISFHESDILKFMLNPKHGNSEQIINKNIEISDDKENIFVKSGSIGVKISKNNFSVSIDREGSELISISGFHIDPKEKQSSQVVFSKTSDEHFYGFGEKFNGLDQSGNRIVMELNDAYMSDDDSTYKSIPFFLSSKRYGLLVNSPEQMVFNMGNKSQTEYDFEIPDTSFEYYIFLNKDPLEVITQYTEITGKSQLIPKWTLEPWLSRRRMTGWSEPAAAEADINMMINNGFRLGVVLWEGYRLMFAGKHGIEMTKLSDKWHSMGIKQVCWDFTGHIPSETPIVTSIPKEYFLQYKDSTFCLGHRNKNNLYINPLNADAMEWWKKNLYEKRFFGESGMSTQKAWNLDGVKLDFGELFPKNDSELLDVDKSVGMHNTHAVLFSEEIYNWLQTIKPEGGITWVRGGGLGLQKAGFVFGGDRDRTFAQLKGTVIASLGASVCGISLVSHDLGGYRGGNSIEAREVYIRGVQYATFSPGFQDHGSAPAPWEQNEYGRDNYSFYSRVRYNLLPYLYHYVKVGNETGLPMMRTLFMLHPEDENTFGIEDEYYLGDNLLVAPVVTMGNNREIYLPEGKWLDFWTQNEYEGKRSVNFETPLNRIPVFVKSGAIVPLGLNDEMQVGGIFPHEQKNSLLLSFRFFRGKSLPLKFFRDEYLEVSKKEDNNLVKVEVKNINENFGLIVDGLSGKNIKVNGKSCAQLNAEKFKKSEEGWRFEKSTNQLFVKIKAVEGLKNYTIEILQPEQCETPECADPKILMPQTEITKITGWDKSVDLYFKSVKEAELYEVKYWIRNNEINSTIIIVPEPHVTINNLVNGKEYNFSVTPINGKLRGEASIVKQVVPEGKTPFFKMENNGLFVNAEHYLSNKIKDDSLRVFTYGLLSNKNEKYIVWMKMKTGIDHFRYARWIKVGEIPFEKGENYFTLQLMMKEIIPSMLYFSRDEKTRPFLKEELEGNYSQKVPSIINEKTIVFPVSNQLNP